MASPSDLEVTDAEPPLTSTSLTTFEQTKAVPAAVRLARADCMHSGLARGYHTFADVHADVRAGQCGN